MRLLWRPSAAACSEENKRLEELEAFVAERGETRERAEIEQQLNEGLKALRKAKRYNSNESQKRKLIHSAYEEGVASG